MAKRNRSKVKFSGVDILEFMEQVVEKHTQYYQSDFQIDKEVLLKTVDKKKQHNKRFIWLCRTHGTWLLLERNVFLKNTRENNTFNFYAEQTSGPILAFMIEVISGAQDSVLGNVYVLDYGEYHTHVVAVSLNAETVVLKYERGYRIQRADKRVSGYPDAEYGELLSVQYQPRSQEELAALLQREREEGVYYCESCANAYISRLP